MSPSPPVALSVAGSDSGGGAGIAADLRTFASLGVHGALALAAVTAQDTLGVRAIEVVPSAHVLAQVDAVLGDLEVRAAKTGMLAAASTVDALAKRFCEPAAPPLVVDPVLVASSGDPLFPADALDAYRRLVAVATLLTPNLHEAALLAGRPVRDLDDMVGAAEALRGLGARAVVVKGGHLAGEESVDVLVDEGGTLLLRAARVATRNTHGTGCTLSAAVAAGLAKGLALRDALVEAKAFVTRALEGAASWRLGAGHGPLDQVGAGRRSGRQPSLEALTRPVAGPSTS